MLKNKMKIITIASSVLLVLIVVLLSIFNNNTTKLYDKIIITDSATLSLNDSVIKAGNISDYNLKGSSYGDEYIITSEIDNYNIKNPVLKFENIINTGISVSVDDEVIYEEGMNVKKNSIVCNSDMIIPLKQDMEGKTIKIILRCVSEGGFSKVPIIYYMNSLDANLYSYITTIVMQIIGIVLISIGVIYIVLFIFNTGLNVMMKKMIYISIVSISAGVWILSCYQVTGMFIDNYILDFYLEYIGIYIMLLFFNYYVQDLTNISKDKFILNILSKLVIVYGIIAVILQVKNIMHMNESIVGLHILSIPAAVMLMRYYMQKNKKDELETAIAYSIVFVMGIFGIAYCVMYWLKMPYGIIKTLPVLFLFFILFGMVSCITEVKKAYASKAESNALMDLIYIDKLTGLHNRRGLDKFDENIRNSGIHFDYTIYSVDLNRLKYINDTYGHTAGDNLIKSFANQVKKVVNKNGFCGRMGGDEFIVVIRDEDYDGKFEEILKYYVDEYNRKSDEEYKLQYSIGGASYNIGGTATIDDGIRMADYNMYEMKMKFKRKSYKDV